MPTRAERQADAARRRAQVMQLRLAGQSFEEIGDQLGISDTRAHQLYQDALDRTIKEPAGRVRQLELRRLDRLELAASKVLAGKHLVVQGGKVVHGDDDQPLVDQGPVLQAINTLLRVAERRAKLLGLDEPVRADVTARIHAEVYSLDALDRELERVTAELAELDPDGAAGERRRQDLARRHDRFRAAWSAPGQITRDPARFVGDGLALLLEGLDLDDPARDAAVLEVEAFLLSRQASP
jgi:hypothetical protein